MTLTELLNPELIFPKIACASKDDLVADLVGRIYRSRGGFPLSQESLLETICAREHIGGTLLPSGLSVPHARLKGFDDFVIALATPALPLFYAGQEIRLAAMMITSQSGGRWYLTALAALTKISRDMEYLSRLCEAQTPEIFIGILRERDPLLA
ncbi:MAG: PTS sugar transporter subunit IIA [Treponema sp.]|nr:PTS sugar transporter subunit IIA [Treponema sp.]